jgi:hypothetical protein
MEDFEYSCKIMHWGFECYTFIVWILERLRGTIKRIYPKNEIYFDIYVFKLIVNHISCSVLILLYFIWSLLSIFINLGLIRDFHLWLLGKSLYCFTPICFSYKFLFFINYNLYCHIFICIYIYHHIYFSSWKVRQTSFLQ